MANFMELSLMSDTAKEDAMKLTYSDLDDLTEKELIEVLNELSALAEDAIYGYRGPYFYFGDKATKRSKLSNLITRMQYINKGLMREEN